MGATMRDRLLALRSPRTIRRSSGSTTPADRPSGRARKDGLAEPGAPGACPTDDARDPIDTGAGMKYYDNLYINGEWATPSSVETITTVSTDGRGPIGTMPLAQMADVDAAVDAARRAFDDPAGW